MTSILRIVPSEAERAAGLLSAQTIERASRSFRDDGALIIEDIIDATIVADARRKFSESYSRYLDSRNHDDALQVGDQRLMITVDLSPPFGDAQLFANQYLLPVLNSALGNDFVIGAFGVFCAWPSAGAQDRHCDGGILFPSSPLNWQLPATAVNVVIPLIEMNEIHGTTALWPGTHRDWARSFAVRNFAQKNDSPDGKIEPVVREGSCMLWDFRLVHGGTANRGAIPRPILYVSYCRPWFLDQENFESEHNPKQKPLFAKADFLAHLSAEQRRLLARARTR